MLALCPQIFDVPKSHSFQKSPTPLNTTFTLTLTEHSSFDFFGLPRELRDDIYDLCLTRRVYQPFPCITPLLRLFNITTVELLLVSHQFAHEYLTREQKLAVMHIDHDWASGRSFRSYNTLPRPARRICQLKVKIECAGFPNSQSGIIDLADQYHLHQVRRIVQQLPVMRTFAIRIFIIGSRLDSQKIASMLWKRGWCETQRLSKLDVYCLSQEIGEPSQKVIRWPKNAKKLRNLSTEIDEEESDEKIDGTMVEE